jgi:hypothetical protein
VPREERARAFDWDRSADHIRARSQNGCIQRPEYMAAPERFAETLDPPLAPRAPSIHGTCVWTGRTLQAGYDDLEIVGLALLYPALEWSASAPGHHGYPIFHQVITPPHPPLKIPPKLLPPHGHGSDQHLPNTSQQARAQAPVGVPIGQVRGVQSPQPAPGRSCGTTAPAGGREP